MNIVPDDYDDIIRRLDRMSRSAMTLENGHAARRAAVVMAELRAEVERLRSLAGRLASDDPIEWTGCCGDIARCFWCGEEVHDETGTEEPRYHREKCPWIEARRLLKGEG